MLDDPSSVDWDDRPDRTWAIPAGVVAYCTANGQDEKMWRKAWGPLAACAAAKHADVAATAARNLLAVIPEGATPPAEAGAFTDVLRKAGLLTGIPGGKGKTSTTAA